MLGTFQLILCLQLKELNVDVRKNALFWWKWQSYVTFWQLSQNIIDILGQNHQFNNIFDEIL
jgi:hypothetical protein